MIYKVKLKNDEQNVLLDEKTYEWLTTDGYLTSVNFINNLRRHSSGCVVFQKTWKKAPAEGGGYKTETIYLHKLIAERFLHEQKQGKVKLVGVRDGNKLNCQVGNLLYRSRAHASRQRKTSSSTGFTGVYREHKQYRAVISIEGKAKHLGMYSTAEAAAYAYNLVSRHFFADEGKINKLAAGYQPPTDFKRPAILPPPTGK